MPNFVLAIQPLRIAKLCWIVPNRKVCSIYAKSLMRRRGLSIGLLSLPET